MNKIDSSLARVEHAQWPFPELKHKCVALGLVGFAVDSIHSSAFAPFLGIVASDSTKRLLSGKYDTPANLDCQQKTKSDDIYSRQSNIPKIQTRNTSKNPISSKEWSFCRRSNVLERCLCRSRRKTTRPWQA